MDCSLQTHFKFYDEPCHIKVIDWESQLCPVMGYPAGIQIPQKLWEILATIWNDSVGISTGLKCIGTGYNDGFYSDVYEHYCSVTN
jgi:hypothetical protein